MLGFVQLLKRQTGAKDVIVDYKKGTAEATWKKGAKFDYAAVKKTVKRSAELTFRELHLTATGEVAEHEGKPAFRVAESNELFFLADGGTAALNGWSRDKAVTVTGKVQDPEQGYKGPLTLVVARKAPSPR